MIMGDDRAVENKPTSQFEESVVRTMKVDGGQIWLLDQRKIPAAVEYFDATQLDDMVYAIREMVVRGAPAIGVAAALGLAAEAIRLSSTAGCREEFIALLDEAKTKLQATRPTAVNLRWGLERIAAMCAQPTEQSLDDTAEEMFACAVAMIEEDISINKSIGAHGARLLPPEATVLTHCNAGALCACGWGTALGVIRSAVAGGKKIKVFVDETRPRQQGARLTCWELLQDNIDTTLIADTMAAHLMRVRKLDAVIVGADRIAANGDVANKIGTYGLAIIAKAHGVPFYVAAPLSTIDRRTATGGDIPIEERHAQEVTTINDQLVCPPDVQVFNPAFDVTPAELISAIITERGLLKPPYEAAIKTAFSTSP